MVSARWGFLGGAAVWLVLGGCSTSRTITGTWANDGPVPLQFTLHPDGTYESDMKMRVPLKLKGTWKYDQPHLTIQIKDVELPEDGSVPMVAQIVKDEALKKFGKIECAVSWKTDDQIVVSGNPPFMGSFRRKP